MKTITFYSYKGGVGRSLALSNVANRLSEFGKKVCIIDFDLEAPGIHLKFAKHIRKEGVKKGLVDYIESFSTSHIVPTNVADFVTKLEFEKVGKRVDIDLIAAGNTQSKEYWKKLSRINWNRLFYDEGSLGVAFFMNFKEQIKTQLSPDFLIIDSRTGITDISGVTMSILADEVVLLAANNRENIEGIGDVISTLSQPENIFSQKVPKINFVLCRIPYFTEASERSREKNVRDKSISQINAALSNNDVNNLVIDKAMIIHSDPELEMEETFRLGFDSEGNGESREIPIEKDYLELFEELTKDVLTDAEKNSFNDFVKAEKMIEDAKNIPDSILRIKHLKAALKINPDSMVGQYQIALAYYDSQQFSSALEIINRVIDKNKTTDLKFLLMKGSCLINLEKLDESLAIYTQVLERDPVNYLALVDSGKVYYNKGQYNQANEIYERALKIYPFNPNVWNNHANNLKMLGKMEEALDAVFKALELDPQSPYATSTLAEIYGLMGNVREFFKNIELALSFGLSTNSFKRILREEIVYQRFFSDPKFVSLLEKYQVELDL